MSILKKAIDYNQILSIEQIMGLKPSKSHCMAGGFDQGLKWSSNG